jgi:hypothetical protein
MSIISAGTTTTTALVETGDTTGNLVLQVNGTTPSLTLNTSGAHGVGASPSYGTSGQVLTSAGSSASPTWTTPSSGAMTLISTQTASSSASLSWTGLSGYDKYMLVFKKLIPASNGFLQLTFGTGAGPTYITSNYNTYVNQSGSYVSNAYIYLSTDAINYLGNTTASGISGFCYLNGFSSSGNATSTSTVYSDSINAATPPYSITNLAGGSTTANSVNITALKIVYSSGNIASGTATLYGISS